MSNTSRFFWNGRDGLGVQRHEALLPEVGGGIILPASAPVPEFASSIETAGEPLPRQRLHRSGSGEVVVANGTLHFLGSDHVQLYAPYRVGLTNYALEAEARFLQPMECCTHYFSLTIRGYNCCNAGVGDYMCGDGVSAFIDRSFGNAECNATSMDTAWHKYRVEVRGNHATLKLDGAIVQQVTDNNYLYLKRKGYQFNGSVGVAMGLIEVDVRVFKIYALR